MDRINFQVVIVTLGFLLSTFMSSLTFAIDVATQLKQPSRYDAKMGCMMCHQSELFQPSKDVKKNKRLPIPSRSKVSAKK